MELSQEIQCILQKYRPQKYSRDISNDNLIDVSTMNFDDETWLMQSNPVPDLQTFFKPDMSMQTSFDSDDSSEVGKHFDSRTFTRPKRSYHHKPMLTEEIDNYISVSATTLAHGVKDKPLHFHLSEPITSNIFENIATNSLDLDSFNNMSPPSLMNSLCSSTFTSLMDNSFIKNDPTLREICDADYSTVICQEIEPPLYQSITESCSSINTEVAETFVRRTLNSLNYTFNRHIEPNSDAVVNDHHNTVPPHLHVENIDPNATYNTSNGTYRKSKHRLHESDDLNATFSVQQGNLDTGPPGFTPQFDNFLVQPNDEACEKKLSDEIDHYLNDTRRFYSDCDKNVQISAKSTDSLDQLSSASNCSGDSKRMADVEAFVDVQEKSLQQIMSTPKVAKMRDKPFEKMQLSPIPNLNIKEHLSDSELSSGEYNTVRSRFSDRNVAKSLSNLKLVDGAMRQRSIHTVNDTNRPVSGLRRPSTGIQLPVSNKDKLSGSYGNLRLINSKFSSSQTNLRPKSLIMQHFPVSGDGEGFKTTQTADINETFVKPKATNLPRPSGATSIPRPTSKIPGLRTSRLPLSKAKKTSRTNLGDVPY